MPARERLRNRIMVGFTDAEYEALERAAGSEALAAFVRRIVTRSLARRGK